MDKRTVNPRFVFFLVLLVAIGIFLLYSRLSFTGYVTNIANATNAVLLSSHSFDTGDFSNTFVNSEGSVALMSGKASGSYTSQVFDAGQPVLWTEFMPIYVMHSSANYSEDPLNNSVLFQVRACDDAACTGKEFVEYSGVQDFLGQYFQYRAVMQIFSGNVSPSFSEVDVSHYPPNTPPVDIWSPQAITYNNESVLINISSNPGAMIWVYNGTDNEPYTAELYRTFPEGTNVINVFVSHIDGKINYTNSGSVTFKVGFLHIFYRLSSNVCSAVTLTNAEKTANDYATLAECQSHVTSTTTTTTTETQTQQSCAPKWECFYNETDGWSQCIDGVQTRTCADTSTCTTVASVDTRPPESRSCTGGVTTTASVVETQPQPETTTAPTETTQKKGFFSFVGSAIIGPVFKSAVGIVFVVLLVLVIGGFFAYKFLLKDKLKFKFNFFKKKKKPFF